MKKLIFALATSLSLPALLFSNVHAASAYTSGATGVDVSYPNCSTKVPAVDFGIVGVTGGLVYSTNSCLANEASHFSNLSLYANTGLNASTKSAYYVQAKANCNGDVYCAAYNYGYSAAQNAVSYAKSQNIASSTWWLDVETSNTWDRDVLQNQKSLQGEYDALVASGATTWTTASQAQNYCTGHQFTGGPSLLMQYKSRKSKLDQDVAC
jgi:hypothetical protein